MRRHAGHDISGGGRPRERMASFSSFSVGAISLPNFSFNRPVHPREIPHNCLELAKYNMALYSKDKYLCYSIINISFGGLKYRDSFEKTENYNLLYNYWRHIFTRG